MVVRDLATVFWYNRPSLGCLDRHRIHTASRRDFGEIVGPTMSTNRLSSSPVVGFADFLRVCHSAPLVLRPLEREILPESSLAVARELRDLYLLAFVVSAVDPLW